jgi:hypothetical protein
VRGEGTHRFASDQTKAIQSGVSPIPRQPPHSKTAAEHVKRLIQAGDLDRVSAFLEEVKQDGVAV